MGNHSSYSSERSDCDLSSDSCSNDSTCSCCSDQPPPPQCRPQQPPAVRPRPSPQTFNDDTSFCPPALLPPASVQFGATNFDNVCPMDWTPVYVLPQCCCMPTMPPSMRSAAQQFCAPSAPRFQERSLDQTDGQRASFGTEMLCYCIPKNPTPMMPAAQQVCFPPEPRTQERFVDHGQRDSFGKDMLCCCKATMAPPMRPAAQKVSSPPEPRTQERSVDHGQRGGFRNEMICCCKATMAPPMRPAAQQVCSPPEPRTQERSVDHGQRGGFGNEMLCCCKATMAPPMRPAAQQVCFPPEARTQDRSFDHENCNLDDDNIYLEQSAPPVSKRTKRCSKQPPPESSRRQTDSGCQRSKRPPAQVRCFKQGQCGQRGQSGHRSHRGGGKCYPNAYPVPVLGRQMANTMDSLDPVDSDQMDPLGPRCDFGESSEAASAAIDTDARAQPNESIRPLQRIGQARHGAGINEPFDQYYQHPCTSRRAPEMNPMANFDPDRFDSDQRGGIGRLRNVNIRTHIDYDYAQIPGNENPPRPLPRNYPENPPSPQSPGQNIPSFPHGDEK
ncbi:uncharacterized protein LOC6591994 [Drosophila persimilis]|uniref:uncharacterized protein LOC6591994 n=1 Tax=Drosophila persimilis TaxID=7234 RepID=UPI000F092961|nr:uncharacterized protein LOC6591994 [Drosophila persimilis]